MNTVWIYVDANKEVGDRDHLKVFANPVAARTNGSRRTILRAWRLNMRSWSEAN